MSGLLTRMPLKWEPLRRKPPVEDRHIAAIAKAFNRPEKLVREICENGEWLPMVLPDDNVYVEIVDSCLNCYFKVDTKTGEFIYDEEAEKSPVSDDHNENEEEHVCGSESAVEAKSDTIEENDSIMSPKQIEKRDRFIEEFVQLCKKHKLCIQSDDPYCGLNVVPYDTKMRAEYENRTSFGRWHTLVD